MPKCTVPILMYHWVTPDTGAIPRKYQVAPRMFAAHLRWLVLAGYTPLTLDTLHAARSGQLKLPPRPVVITFDDGSCDCYTNAAPILQAQHFTAVFFLVTGLMGGTAKWLSERWKAELPLMDWADAQQLVAAGFQIGSHTVNHVHLAELDDAACQRELHDSRVALEDRLGRSVQHLAYPFGSFNTRVRNIAADCGYFTACSTIKGLSTSHDDSLALRRVPVIGQDSLLDFAWRLRLGYNVHETFQVAVWRIRRLLRSKSV